MIVVAIIGMAAVAIPAFMDYMKKSKKDRGVAPAQQDLQEQQGALHATRRSRRPAPARRPPRSAATARARSARSPHLTGRPRAGRRSTSKWTRCTSSSTSTSVAPPRRPRTPRATSTATTSITYTMSLGAAAGHASAVLSSRRRTATNRVRRFVRHHAAPERRFIFEAHSSTGGTCRPSDNARIDDVAAPEREGLIE